MPNDIEPITRPFQVANMEKELVAMQPESFHNTYICPKIYVNISRSVAFWYVKLISF